MSTVSATPPLDLVGYAPERFSVSTGNLSRRLDAWAEILATTLVPFELQATDASAQFRGVLKRCRFAELALVECAAAPCLGRRGQALVDGGSDSGDEVLVGVSVIKSGTELARDRRREVTISAGELTLWDSRRAVDVEVLEPVHKLTLLFPLEVVKAVCSRLPEPLTLPPLVDSGSGRLLARYISGLAAELDSLDATGRAAAATAAVELLRAAVEPALPANRHSVRAALRADVRRYVRGNLGDPELGPESIARAHAISLRTLHKLFEDMDESVAKLIRRERLARCMQDLQRPGSESVTSIAFRWGFGDSSHFCRAFKRAFGVTPTAARQAARERERG